MDITQYVLLAAVIAGITELLTRLRAKDYWTAATIGIAAITGGLFGFFEIESLTIVTGIAAGFGASGTLTGIGMIGNRTAAKPTDLTR